MQIFFIVIFFVCSTIYAEDATFKPLPKWYNSDSDSLLKLNHNKISGFSLRYHYWNNQVNLLGAKKHTLYEAILTPVLKEGLEDASNLSVNYAPAFEQFHWHFIKLYRNGHLIKELTISDIKQGFVEPNYKLSLLYGGKTSLAVIPEVQEGDKIHYAYSIIGNNPALGQHSSWRKYFTWGIPVDFQKFEIITRSNQQLYFREHNQAPKVTITQTKTISSYVWVDSNLQVSEYDSRVPSWYSDGDIVEVSTFKDWQEVKDWIGKLYPDQYKLPQSLRDTLSSWGALSNEQFIIQASRLVQQDIRYLGLEIGANAYRPHSIDSIWLNKYGDCKDKTSLLIALLRSQGILAWPSLVHTDNSYSTKNMIPSHAVFNHVIVMAKDGDKTYWIDGTHSKQSGTYDSQSQLRLKSALVLKDTSSGLTEIVMPPFKHSHVSIFDKVQIHSEDSVTLEILTEYRYKNAQNMRAYFRTTPQQKITKDLQDYLMDFYGEAELIDTAEWVDNEVENRFILKEKYQLKNYLNVNSGRWDLEMNGFLLWDYILRNQVVKRNSPIDLFHNINVIHRLEVLYEGAEDFDWQGDTLYTDKNIHFDFVGRQGLVKGGIFSEWSLKYKKDFATAEEWLGLAPKMNKMYDESGFSVVLLHHRKEYTDKIYHSLWKALGIHDRKEERK